MVRERQDEPNFASVYLHARDPLEGIGERDRMGNLGDRVKNTLLHGLGEAIRRNRRLIDEIYGDPQVAEEWLFGLPIAHRPSGMRASVFNDACHSYVLEGEIACATVTYHVRYDLNDQKEDISSHVDILVGIAGLPQAVTQLAEQVEATYPFFKRIPL